MKVPKLPLRLLATGIVLAAATIAGRALWKQYVAHPWTRMAQVQANVIRMAPRVSGVVIKVPVTDNQFVHAGDLLFEIDPSAYALQVKTLSVQLEQAQQAVQLLEAVIPVRQASVKEATAAVASAKGQIKAAAARVTANQEIVAGADAGVDASRAQVAAAKAMLLGYVQQRDRAQRLAEKGAGPVAIAQALEATVQSGQAGVQAAEAGVPMAAAALAQARAGLAEAKANQVIAQTALGEVEARLTRAEADLEHARVDLGVPSDQNVRVRAAQVALAAAELDLSWTRIEAPADGYVTNVRVYEGAFASPGVQMIAFVDASSFWVVGYFRETQLDKIHQGDRARITLIGRSDAELEGEVTSIGWAINPPNIATLDGPNGVVPQVQPSFDWIRLAQRVPVNIKLTSVPKGVRLVAGTTVSVAID